MSERILKALMQLFAIIAGPRSSNRNGRNIVESFLKQQISEELVDEYLKLFDGFYALYQKKQSNKGTQKAKNLSLSSVKVLKICTHINEELTQKQKLVVLIRLMEFVNADVEVSEQELEFVYTVSDIFHYPLEEYEFLKNYIFAQEDTMPQSARILLINGNPTTTLPNIRHLYQHAMLDEIWVYYAVHAEMYLVRFFGSNEHYLNGHMLASGKVYALSNGSALRDSKMHPIYYSDIVSAYHVHEFDRKIVFEASQVEYEFKGGKKGLNTFSFTEESGNLIGIMGGSGSGKTTLLNVLNSSYKPSRGSVKINGVDIHAQKELTEGVIGHVAQDDLLIEELTVFQNLFFNAKLCFGDMSNMEINRKVMRTLQSIGLLEIKEMVVGNPLNKKISGGQRKRLNIALELIREPSVLFLDEPTSGLSSRDSENIMDLLKELTLKGKLVFCVIHQPSSDIFKMFDKLYIMDQGGYLIYNGNPVNSIMYFKSNIQHANRNDSECRLCGNVNPEQIFNIIEATTLDEYGNLTQRRRTSPEQWNRRFRHAQDEQEKIEYEVEELPPSKFAKPNKLRQFFVFITRDALAKLANRQYLIINIAEVPILAFLLSFIVKYYSDAEEGYTLSGNPNLPVYLLIAVIIAIFVGLTVSAEEIIKDQKILKREKFLNLSRTSYIWSKLAILFLISAIQAAVFVLIGNTVMGIRDMYFQYWLMLFSAWFFANIMGLIISDSFDTVVTIYILIPFLVIPQLILSGIIISFDKLNPKVSSQHKIPWYGEIITARWAYEGLAVYQYKNNAFEEIFYPYNKLMSEADYKKNFWIKTLENKLSFCERNYQTKVNQLRVKANLELLRNEFLKELVENDKVQTMVVNDLTLDRLNESVFEEAEQYLSTLRTYYLRKYKKVSDMKDEVVREMQQNDLQREAFVQMKKRYTNDNLTAFVRNTNSMQRITEYHNHLYQKTDPIYMEPESRLIKAHFYAPYKRLFHYEIDTFWANVMVIWLANALLYFMLQFRLLRKLLAYIAAKMDRGNKKS